VKVTATALRADLYRLLDAVLETGEPLEVERHGRILRVVADAPRRRLDDLPRRDALVGTFDELVETSFAYVPEDGS
jgi:hypothetical protein